MRVIDAEITIRTAQGTRTGHYRLVTEQWLCGSCVVVAWCFVCGLGFGAGVGACWRGWGSGLAEVFGLVVRGVERGFRGCVGLILGLLSVEWCVER